jgi:hypothetical protein
MGTELVGGIPDTGGMMGAPPPEEPPADGEQERLMRQNRLAEALRMGDPGISEEEKFRTGLEEAEKDRQLRLQIASQRQRGRPVSDIRATAFAQASKEFPPPPPDSPAALMDEDPNAAARKARAAEIESELYAQERMAQESPPAPATGVDEGLTPLERMQGEIVTEIDPVTGNTVVRNVPVRPGQDEGLSPLERQEIAKQGTGEIIRDPGTGAITNLPGNTPQEILISRAKAAGRTFSPEEEQKMRDMPPEEAQKILDTMDAEVEGEVFTAGPGEGSSDDYTAGV